MEVVPADLGAVTSDRWDVMEFSLVHVETGESFTTDDPWFTCCDGMAVFHVRQGSASFIVDGPVDLYSAKGDGNPVRIADASLFALEAGDTAVFAVEHPAIVTNTGADELLMLGGYAYEFGGPVTSIEPDGYLGQPEVFDTTMEPIPAEALYVSFEQVVLEPGERTHIESSTEERIVGWYPETNTTVRMMPGLQEALPEDHQGSFMVQSFVVTDWSPVPYTLFNAGKNPATLTFMRIASAASASATPQAAMPVEGQETSASVQPLSMVVADPDALPIGDPGSWNETYFEFASLEAGATIEPGSRPGLAGILVLEGAMDVKLAGPAQITRAGDLTTVESFDGPGSVSLQAGDAIWYGLDTSPNLTNLGESATIYLSLTANDQPDPGQAAAPGESQLASASDAASTSLESGPVHASIHRMDLGPNASVPVDVRAGEPALAVVAEGQIRYYQDTGAGPPDASLMHEPDADNGIALHALEAGPWVIGNSENAPATVYLLRLTNDLPVDIAGGPFENVVNAAFRPMAHSFGADPGWDQAYLAESTLEPFSSVSSTDPVFGCCNGVQVITVLEGELTVQMDLPMQVMTMGNDPAGSMNPVVLRPGESALFESHMVATNTGSTRARFLHGGVFAAVPSTEASETDYGFLAGDRIITSFAHDPADSMQSLNIDHVTIEPGKTVPVTITANDAFLLLADDGSALTMTYPVADGDAPASMGMEGIESLSSDMLDPGTYEIENAGSDPVTVFTLRIGPDLAPPVP
ncbi:hypothetical protein BH24CHL4_BH24CHL4_13180 [soil metagenome]